jgi:hypothetical protein
MFKTELGFLLIFSFHPLLIVFFDSECFGLYYFTSQSKILKLIFMKFQDLHYVKYKFLRRVSLYVITPCSLVSGNILPPYSVLL